MKKTFLLVAALIFGCFMLNAQTISIGEVTSHHDQFYVGQEVSVSFSTNSMTLTPTDGYGEIRTYDVSTETQLEINPNKVEVIQLRHPNSIYYGEDEGITSYVCTSSLNFSDLDPIIKAYIAVSNDDTSITLAKTTGIKAGEAFVARGDAGYYCIPVTESNVDYGIGMINKFRGTTNPQEVKIVTSSETNIYALGAYGTFANVVAAPGTSITIPVKKAYLVADNVSSAKSLNLHFSEDEATIINSVDLSPNEVNSISLMNIMGQPVNKDYRGIIIKNGTKYIHR